VRTLVAFVALLLIACGGATTSTPTSPTSPPTSANCSATSVGLTPLTDLRSATYKGEPGGLYPGRSNTRPATHDAAGAAIANQIRPLDDTGAPNPDGRYVFVSIGMSNTTMEFSVFKPLADAEPGKNRHLVIVDGAQGGQTAAIWSTRSFAEVPWTVLDSRLKQAGVTPQQVAVIWLKEADASPTSGWPAYAQALEHELLIMLQRLKEHFPHLQIAYLSSRIYAGYAITALNPEPYAYESGFSVKWTIEAQLRGSAGTNYDPNAGTAVCPWLSWGPYLWTDGMNGRSDGLTWSCSDVRSNDGTHPSDSGSRKVAQLLLDFIRTDATTRAWFYE
jgi:hypothetical protein